jgi:AraC-like DNA-binding protein/ligand-binding sensor protein
MKPSDKGISRTVPETFPSADGDVSETRPSPEPEILDDFGNAFTRASGLPMTLTSKEESDGHCYGQDLPGFCHLIHSTGNPHIKALCRFFNSQLEKDSSDHSHCTRCFAGFQMSAVPVSRSGETVAFFKTGHVMPKPTVPTDFRKVMSILSRSGLEELAKRAKEAWLATPVMDTDRYQAFVDLLGAYARQISKDAMKNGNATSAKDSPALREARRYIEANSTQRLTLAGVAGVVGLSPNYFSNKFHDFTGVSFTDYLAGVRVANATCLLSLPGCRINEIAFDVGFNSIAQFNRVFRKVTGMSPSAYRCSLITEPEK